MAMHSRFSRFAVDLRAASPVRAWIALSALGSALIGFCYLVAPDRLLKFTDLYIGLQSFNAVKVFGLVTMVAGLMLVTGAVKNSRSMIGLWSFQLILVWIFAGALFVAELPDSWFTILAIWIISFTGPLYARYLAMRPPPDEDDDFDGHVVSARERAKALVDRTNANMLD